MSGKGVKPDNDMDMETQEIAKERALPVDKGWAWVVLIGNYVVSVVFLNLFFTCKFKKKIVLNLSLNAVLTARTQLIYLTFTLKLVLDICN